jgi:hypothetical protein
MKKKLKISVLFSLILGIISTAGLFYNFFTYEIIRPKTLAFEPLGTTETYMIFIWISMLIAFLFHFSAFITSFFRFQYLKKTTLPGMITLFLCIISFVGLVGDWALLNDIGKEYKLGIATNSEWNTLYLLLLAHGLFYVFMFGLLIQTFKALKQPEPSDEAIKDEIIFTIAQYVGIICGSIGLGFTFAILIIPVANWMLKYLILFYCPFFIFPYGLIVLYWLLLKRKEKISEWYDEKQWQDVTKAGWLTLLLSIPGLGLLYLINLVQSQSAATVLWFPYYLFLILLLFSGGTLYFGRQGNEK